MKIEYISKIPQDFEEKPEFDFNMQLQKGDEYEFTEKQLTPRMKRKIAAMIENRQCVEANPGREARPRRNRG